MRFIFIRLLSFLFFYIISFSRCSLVCPLLHLCNRFQKLPFHSQHRLCYVKMETSRGAQWSHGKWKTGTRWRRRLCQFIIFFFQAFQGLLENEVCAPLSTHQQRWALQENLCEIRSRKRIFSIFCSNSNILPMAFACVCYRIHVMWCDYITLHWVYELLHCCLSDSLSIHTTARRDDKCVL